MSNQYLADREHLWFLTDDLDANLEVVERFLNVFDDLRAVARSARYFLNGNWDFKEGSDAYDRHEILIDTLDAVPAWVFDNEG